MIAGPGALLLRARRRAGRLLDEALARHTAAQTAVLRSELAALRDELDARVRSEVDRAVAEIRAVEIRDRRDTIAATEREVVAGTARFVREHLGDAVPLSGPEATLEHALGLAPTGGMALEFGVYRGETLRAIAAHRGDGRVHGFDTFTGLPENWRPGFPAGAFDDLAELPEVPGAELVVGLFDDTLDRFLATHPGPVDFLHVDSDLYSSAVTVLEAVGPRLRPGSIVLFDEFFNFPDWERHEARAWWEYAEKHGVRHRYACYTHDHEQVAVRIEGTAPHAGPAPRPR
ncbi:Predicted O-methyltransferase YrrM [Pseudonocardia ammonioxydans]|uniref:Predicted O-methyltransferase YrrM n=1 Tax=Pseudonocardia ammonioxydans TaxID=260086 RepID=A0A1I5A745_PSUAM|nr:class I SAM-dependent methyltransferase [Pseudonocardia ammonioxydans]SFN58180.1 Predicted O-methyltransferase YrrM [Pseudonocardia ammonioxydans]